NRVLVTKPHNKTPYELLHGRIPSIGFMRPFGCLVTILNTLDSLGKFNGKVDEGFLVGYFVSSKAFRVFNSRTRIVQETLHVNFLENKPNVAGSGLTWLFDIDTLTKTMNYQPVTEGNQSNHSAGFQDKFDAKKKGRIVTNNMCFFLLGLLVIQILITMMKMLPEFDEKKHESEVNVSPNSSAQLKKHDDKTKHEAKGKKSEDITYSYDEDDVGAEADFNNLETSITYDKDGERSRNKKDERGIAVRNKARLVAHGHTQEDGIDYEEVFAIVARIEAIRLFLAYASFMGFMVYQMDVKSAFLYGTIEEEVYIYVDDIIFGSTNKDLCKSFEKLMKDKFQMISLGELTLFLDLQVKQKKDGIFISQDKYVAEILRKFGLTDRKSASTPIDTEKPLLKDPDGEDVDVHTYISMIGSLMCLTSSRPDIMFVVCTCDHFQVTPKASHLHAVKRIFRYLKGKPHLGLWYLKDSPFDLVAYSDSDYPGASLVRMSTTEGCQFLGCRLISWQCKKKIVVATSSTEAEYVAAASCCVQVLWI
nr:hypothetical protein [Tanacetum cinerariifolium]